MINQTYKKMLEDKSVIRSLSEYASKRALEIGAENVFDFTLGNPSVPCTDDYTNAIIDLHKNENPSKIHGYSPSLGILSVKKSVADSLNKRFDMNYTENHIFMTSGASGALAHAIRAVTVAGDEIITFAPFFPEYIPYVETYGTKLSVVPANIDDFQINFEIFEQMLNKNVMAILINTPNNPSGIVYSTKTIQKLADILKQKQKEYGNDIFIISDEPYREILFNGADSPYISKFYDNTISCYSFSKSLSLPGERIGYVAISPKATDSDVFSAICGQISRGIGHNCPSSSIQLAVSSVIDQVSDLSVYETNMNLLYDALIKIGFEVVKPSGTFYIFPKCLEEDATSFCMKARDYDLILVPSDSFGCKSHFRIAYCTDTDKVLRSIPVFEKFAKEVYSL